MLKGQKKGTTVDNRVIARKQTAKIAITHKGETVWAIIDTHDVDRLKGRRWNLFNGYVGSKYPAFVYLHRFLVGASKGSHVDHKDGDKLNNRRKNLRHTSPSKNQGNRKVRNKNNTSGYRGVMFSRDSWRKSRWRAVIKVNYKSKHLGYFKTLEEAALAYNKAAKEHFGEFAVLNEVS